jgi:succinate dehydrogenase / fumarate reductase cytochrome b subunit
MVEAPPRPLSPHVQVWRWHVTMAASISHRLTGMALYAGAILLALWALALAEGPAAFAAYTDAFRNPIGWAVLFVIILSAFFHLANGIRHLAWDLGFGFRLKTANATAWIVFVFGVIAAVGFFARMSAFGAFGHG